MARGLSTSPQEIQQEKAEQIGSPTRWRRYSSDILAEIEAARAFFVEFIGADAEGVMIVPAARYLLVAPGMLESSASAGAFASVRTNRFARNHS